MTANSTSYELEMYSFYKYDDIGIKKKKNGKIKCFCSDIVQAKEIFDSETKIDEWNTGSPKEIRTDKMIVGISNRLFIGISFFLINLL